MKAKKLSGLVRILLFVCALALVATLFVPLWRIDLDAPQYPEGLRLLIFANKLGGNVDIVNGLNHYIGMKTLHANDFVEFTVLPYLLGFFALAFLLIAITANKRLLNVLLVLFISFGVFAMFDFWRWEYNYGHNLNPDAAIIVPGMSYQPPLIGFKQLLNFGAYSVPAFGGWLIVSAGVLLVTCVVLAYKKHPKIILKNPAPIAQVLVIMILLNSCNAGPEAIKPGIDNCAYCKMMVTDLRYVSEIVTKKGRIFKFDDAHCLLSYLRNGQVQKEEIKDIYFADFSDSHPLVNSSKVIFLQSDALRSPMNGNIVAFTDEVNMHQAMKDFPGKILQLSDVIK